MTQICPVSWGFESALTEDPEKCGELAEYVVYLDCNHDDTVAYKKDNFGRVCRKHAKYVHDRKGICGCSWIVINERLYPEKVPAISVKELRPSHCPHSLIECQCSQQEWENHGCHA
jgi:hypothetical protein